MVRQALGKHYIGMNKEFRFRGEEPGRLENFSDAAFALAITLLLISTSAPTTLDQIKKFAWELIPFCACIVLIVLIWHEHFVFYYRYGLRNTKVIVLNTIFLIIVLFYVYPLRFLWKFLLLNPLARAFNQESILKELSEMARPEDTGALMIIYGLGAASIFLILMLMYRYALKNSHHLELNKIEEFDTRASMTSNFLMATVPLLSVILAFLFINSPWAGMISGFSYFLYMPLMFIYSARKTKQRKKILEELNSPSFTGSSEG
jgi:uncharacterized membrane protein